MAARQIISEDEYRPSYGTLVVRDAAGLARPTVTVSNLLERLATEAITGTVARSGRGWVDAAASDTYHAVRLEAHDSEPGDDLSEWSAVVELPLLSAGAVVLSEMMGAVYSDPLPLGPPGPYRVRFARRPAEEGDLFRLQFWNAPWPVEPPRWVVRDGPWAPASAGDRFVRPASDVMTLALWAAESATPTTLTFLADRLLADVGHVREVLGYGVERRLLTVGGDLHDPRATLTIVVQPRRRPSPSAAAAVRARTRATLVGRYGHGWRWYRAGDDQRGPGSARAAPSTNGSTRLSAGRGTRPVRASDGRPIARRRGLDRWRTGRLA